MNLTRLQRGFSLIELLVVIGIIAVLATITIGFISEARDNARAKSRISDLAQLEFALRSYKEVYRDYPQYVDGINVGRGELIDSELDQFWPEKIKDPVNSDGYGYWYDSAYLCNGQIYTVVMAGAGAGANIEDVCGASNVSSSDSPPRVDTGPATGLDLHPSASAYIILVDGPYSQSAIPNNNAFINN